MWFLLILWKVLDYLSALTIMSNVWVPQDSFYLLVLFHHVWAILSCSFACFIFIIIAENWIFQSHNVSALEHKRSSGQAHVHPYSKNYLWILQTSMDIAFLSLTVSSNVIYCLKQPQCSTVASNCFWHTPLGKRLFCWVSSKSSQIKTASWMSLPGNFGTGHTVPIPGKGVWRVSHILSTLVASRLLFFTKNVGYWF